MTRVLLGFGMVLALASCDDPVPTDGDADADADVDTDADTDGDADGECAGDGECDDGQFCNGSERCAPDDAEADDRGCVAGDPPCDEVPGCDEAEGRCLTACDVEPDSDGDGHDAVECGGDDCDDSDIDRFPGNTEVCDVDGHDEDCNEATLGDRDADNDGYVDATCCNGDICGGDCDDERSLVNPDASEICNNRDDNCNGDIDEAGAFCPVGMCMGNRCQAVPWEWTFPAADDDAVWGLETDSMGSVYLGLNAEGSDIDGDGVSEYGGTLAAFSSDGRVRWVVPSTEALGTRLPSGRSRLAASPSGEIIAISADDAVDLRATSDGASVATIGLSIDGATGSQVVGVGTLERGIVAAVEFTQDTGEQGLELFLIDDTGDELGRTRLNCPSCYYELRDIDTSDRFVALIGNTAAAYEIAGTTVTGLHLVKLDVELTPVSAYDLDEFATRVAVSSEGDLAITGEFTGDFAPEWEESRSWTADGTDAFVALFEPDWTPRYTRVHTGAGEVTHNDISFDGREGYFEVGGFTDILSLPPRGAFGPATGTDAFYALVDANEDFTLDAFALSGGGGEWIIALKADVYGALVIAGTFGRDGITLPSSNTYPGVNRNNVFLVRLAEF